MTFGKCPFHRMEIGSGNWTGIRNCCPMHLISQMKDWLSGITDWAELSLTGHALPAHGTSDLGSYQKCPLTERKGLFYCHVSRTWDHVLESEKGEIKKKKKIKKGKKKRTCQKILYYHGFWANCTTRICRKQTALPDSCENFTLIRQPTSALITTSRATPRNIFSKSAS